MYLDKWMPAWDVRSYHQIEIQADASMIYDVLLRTDFSRNPLHRVLVGLRAIPAFLLAPGKAWRRWNYARLSRRTGPMESLLASGFTQLELVRPSHAVFGITGRFWTAEGELVPTDASTFRDPVPQGLARGVWGFHIEPLAPGRGRLQTETRVICGDAITRRRFLCYWRLVRHGSGLIRWALLRQVKAATETAVSKRT